MRKELNFLISSAGRRGELVQILRQVIEGMGLPGNVFTTDCSPLTSAGWLSDGLDLVPRISDSGFIDAVLDVCARREVTHVIPTIDTELPSYAASKDRFMERGVNVWVSGVETVEIAGNKRLTNSWLRENDFPTVEQWDLEDALTRAARVPFPLVAKPANGSSSIGLRIVQSAEELAALEPELDYVVETVATGMEHTIDVLVGLDGQCRAAVPRRRLETRAGEVSKGLTVRDDDLISLASAVAERLPSAYGVMNIQVFKDADTNAVKVIELNARFGGGFPLTWAAGARMPHWLALEHADGQPEAGLLTWTDHKLMLRYDAAAYLDVPASHPW